jgi:hypothetical protein
MEENSVKHILVLGKHQYMVENIIEEYQPSQLDMIVFTGAVNPSDHSSLLTWKDEKFPHALIFEHHGGPATLLEEVQARFLSVQ